jgi:penicillin-binding protein 2
MVADNSRHRLGLIAVCGLTLFGALFARLWFLQVVEAEAYDSQVNESIYRTVVIPAPRGNIYDRNGIAFVRNRETIAVSIDRTEYSKVTKKDRPALLSRLSTTLNRYLPPARQVSVADITSKLNDQRYSPYRPVPIAEDVSVDLEIFLSEQADRFPSVDVERHTVREYPYGSLAAHVLGRVGAITDALYTKHKDDTAKPYSQNDEIGLSGVEQTYESYLRGTPGKRVYEVDRALRPVRELMDKRVDPIPGDDVYLSIDARLQYKTEEALQTWIVKSKTKTPEGAATVLDPRNGQVLAMASYPTFDPRELVGGISTEKWNELNTGTKPMLNRAMSEGYPAASTFKLATSYAGMKLGLFDPAQYFEDRGTYNICRDGSTASWCIKQNAGKEKHGAVNLSAALTVSSDTYFYKIGQASWETEGLGEDALQSKIGDLGYGTKTGIDLPGESGGLVPTPKWLADTAKSIWEANPANYHNSEREYLQAAKWGTGQSANLAIGQGSTLVTTLQTANAYASLANGDNVLYKPSIVAEVRGAGKDRPVHYAMTREEREIRRVDYGAAKADLLSGFAGAVQSKSPRGTAYSVFAGFPLDSFPVSGKTGTAQTGTNKPDNSMFVGYGPNPNNAYVVSVMVKGGGFGSEAAAPATRMIFEPIANGSINDFQVPVDGTIDVAAAVRRLGAASAGGGSD